MTDWTPTIARIHMELASPTCDRTLVTRLLGTFTERTAAIELATTTADHLRAHEQYRCDRCEETW